MKIIISLAVFLLSTPVFSQQTGDPLDSLLLQEITSARQMAGVPEFTSNVILTSCSRHHTAYMAQSGMVSHYQDMKIKKMRRLYSPKDRIAFFSNEMALNESYSEICLALPVDETAFDTEIAAMIIREIVNSENRVPLLDPAARHFGVSVLQRKSVVYATITIGMGYHNIVALLE